LLVCALRSLLSVAFVCGDDRGGFLPPGNVPADVRSSALAGDLSCGYRLPEGSPSVVGCSSSGLQRSLGYGASVLCSFRAEFSTFLPASSPSLFLIPADLKRMATFGGHACLSLPTVLRAIVPEGKGVPCLKFTIPIFNSRIPAVMAAFGLWWLSRCWS